MKKTKSVSRYFPRSEKDIPVEICYRDRDCDDAITMWEAGYSKEDIDELLKRHPSWYRSSVVLTEGGISA